MSTLLEEQQLESLNKFKEYMNDDVRKHCESEYGAEVFAHYIHPYFADMLECVEHHIADLSETVLEDQEFLFDDYDEEDIDES